MPKVQEPLPLSVFVRRLYRRAMKATGGEPLFRIRARRSRREKLDAHEPWDHVVQWIASRTDFTCNEVDAYMVACATGGGAREYIRVELRKWWEGGGQDALITAFWRAYPREAEGMDLPKPTKRVEARKRGKRAKRSRRVTTKATPDMVKAHELRTRGFTLRKIRDALKGELGKKAPKSPTTVAEWIRIADEELNPKSRSKRVRRTLPQDRRG